MRHDEEALLATICATPEDDLPRLVYADLLEDSGDPIRLSRAEFIRVQCKLAQMKSGHPDRDALQERERVLLTRHRRDWNGRVHRLLVGTPLQGQVRGRRALVRVWNYRRGFIAELTARASAVVTHADLLMSLGPIERLKIWGSRGGGTQWARRPRRAPNNPAVPRIALDVILQSPLLRIVRELDLSDHPMNNDDRVVLARTTLLTGLRVLHLGWVDPAQRPTLLAAARQGRFPEPTF